MSEPIKAICPACKAENEVVDLYDEPVIRFSEYDLFIGCLECGNRFFHKLKDTPFAPWKHESTE